MPARYWTRWHPHDGSGYPLPPGVEAQVLVPTPNGGLFKGPAPPPEAINWFLNAPLPDGAGGWYPPVLHYRTRIYPAAALLLNQAATGARKTNTQAGEPVLNSQPKEQV